MYTSVSVQVSYTVNTTANTTEYCTGLKHWEKVHTVKTWFHQTFSKLKTLYFAFADI